jgi:biotin synthase
VKTFLLASGNAHKAEEFKELMFGNRQYEVFDKGANAIILGDYLTTLGKRPKDDILELESLGYKIAKNFHLMPDEK